jgi:hypothetical protein
VFFHPFENTDVCHAARASTAQHQTNFLPGFSGLLLSGDAIRQDGQQNDGKR